MSALLLSPPAAEPISLAEAKQFLRVAHDDDDDVIGALIAGSRIHVEAQTRRALITQTWRIALDTWPASGAIPIVPSPLQQVSAARVYRADNTAETINLASFALDLAADPNVILFSPGVLPMPGRTQAGTELDVAVGYGDAGDDVPEPLRQAIRLLLAHWYENRSVVGTGATALPHNVTALIAPYRILSL